MPKKVAMVLAGSGAKDGTEIHEAVLTILNFKKHLCNLSFYALDELQSSVINMKTGEKMQETRNMLVEGARISRGEISDLKELNAKDADILVFPGGLGAAKNLSNFFQKGESYEVHPEVNRVILDFYENKKPIGFICIAPVIGAKVLGDKGVKLTIGSDKKVSSIMEKMGAKHIESQVCDSVVDKDLKVVSTSAYMLAKDIVEVDKGISSLVKKLLDL